ncbi:17269_t:CDS:2, partial [Dentiscutata erythropus]
SSDLRPSATSPLPVLNESFLFLGYEHAAVRIALEYLKCELICYDIGLGSIWSLDKKSVGISLVSWSHGTDSRHISHLATSLLEPELFELSTLFYLPFRSPCNVQAGIL